MLQHMGTQHKLFIVHSELDMKKIKMAMGYLASFEQNKEVYALGETCDVVLDKFTKRSHKN